MESSIQTKLDFLYGKSLATETGLRLSRLIERHRTRSADCHGALARPLTQSDTILITYGDQVREEGFTPLRTLTEVARAHLAETVSAIHILPFYPWTSDDGFSVKDFFAVDPALGTWADIAHLRQHFDLMFDAVFNHMSSQGEWFQRFLNGDPEYADFFVTVEGTPDLSKVIRPRALPLLTEFQSSTGPKKVWTTFSADQVDVNAKNPVVLLKLIEALLFYVEHGARYIRLDAIAFLWKEIGTTCLHLPETHSIIQIMRSVLDEVAPHAKLITETNVPHQDNISYFGDGTNEAQLVYNFALPPLVLHSIATGNASKLTSWAWTLKLPSDDVTFFNFLSSHDGIGLNPAKGILSQDEIDALVVRAQAHGGFVSYKHNPDGTKSPYELNVTYFDALSNPAVNEPIDIQIKRFLVAHAIMLSLAGVPGIYFHSLFGSRNDRAGAESSKMPRRINREKLDRVRFEQELSEPASLRSKVFNGLREWLALRRTHAALAPAASQRVLDLDPRVFAVMRECADGKDRVLCLHNVSGELLQVQTPDAGLGTQVLAPYEARWIG